MTPGIPQPAEPPDSAPRATRVITVGVLKGGTGKTRLAMLIALFLAVVMGRKVVVIDADSASQTASKWPLKARARGYAWPIEVIRHPFETIDGEIDRLRARGDVDDVIVDVGGGNHGPFLSAVRRTNILLVPLCPDEGDIEQAPPTREAALMAASRNTVGGCMMYFLLSRCDRKSTNDIADARDLLLYDDPDDGPYPLLDVVVPLLSAYRKAYGRIPGIRGPQDVEHVTWKSLDLFIPLLVETGIITRDDAIATGLIIDRELTEAGV
jgi:chromosome partitioning protein